MYNKIRITVASLLIMTLCALSSTATLSYFTDTDAATNEFTIGNASTTLSIYEDENSTEFNASHHSPVVKDIPFYLSAENTGNIPVYQRFRVVIPIELASVVTPDLLGSACDDIATNENKSCSNDDYTVTYDDSVEVGTATYAEYYITSKTALGVNAKTKNWPMTKLKISTQVGELSDIQKSLLTCENGSDNNCKLGIKVYSDAIQTAGFTDAVSAFANFTEKYD
ncbi:MAG: SipW-dependent-type signal peptide-containing protein [Candidatus Saccharibacteria bacterium]|nr:SipW-dependent-type signal peptide-containing protein [Candidatus Saccharibacteria bacterium]